MQIQKISVVIPIYNESKNLPELILRLKKTLDETGKKYELIFIDDHSTDETDEIFEIGKGYKEMILQKKKGKKGKAFSLAEGFAYSTGDTVVMIDADLQYPPEDITGMVNELQNADIVVANRKNYNDFFLRRVLSRTFRFGFGKLLFGLNYDIQSGLKVFSREVIQTINFNPASQWTFDLEMLHLAKEAGFAIKSFDIDFEKRKNGNSNINIINTAFEIGFNALKLKLRTIYPIIIKPESSNSMLGAGVRYNKKLYVTHTTLPHHVSAIKTFTALQKTIITCFLLSIILGLFLRPFFTLQLLVAFLSFIYFVDVFFNLYLILKSLSFPREIVSSEEELEELEDKDLPIYTILCPLYKEAHVIPQFIDAINKLSYPKVKLDIILLLEEDDMESIGFLEKMRLPDYIRTIIVPHSIPKTKPKACNYGLALARGEYLVIFDAEDIPEPMQLKKAILGFKKVSKETICLQAKLNYYNPHQNLLTRFFTAEYSLWFDVTLTGLQSINTSIPLGGTSNHFKTESLRKIEGWDPFNVTEDADLGIRLFRRGYKTAIFNSITLEEANSKYGNWLRQRSRWIKGYMQTYLVHVREAFSFTKEKGVHSLIFQLVIGGKIAFVLINPILWIATFSYFAFYAYVGPQIETLYPSSVFYMAVISLVFGNFLFLYYYMIGVAKKRQWNLMKFVLLIPIYWIMISIAAFIALYQLIFKPYYWEKTVHGFHLAKSQQIPNIFAGDLIYVTPSIWETIPYQVKKRLRSKISLYSQYLARVFSTLAPEIGSFSNFLYSALLGSELNLAKSQKIPDIFAGELIYVAPPKQKNILYQVKKRFQKATITLDLFKEKVKIFENNVIDFIGLFKELKKPYVREDKLKILIFNWRDTKHKWAGGAEVYIHELAKRWVKQGNSVTIFCGNKDQNPENDIIDGINIIRRGGFYTVYFWAFLYYIFKFRGNYNIIIDSENGIPFFTPLYSKIPKFLLIHHVHQEVFRKSLRWPLSSIALFLEARVMPLVYRNVQFITVSPSSKEEILKLKLTKKDPLIIYNGVDSNVYKPGVKNINPLILYLGRLQYYKSLHVFIVAASKVLHKIPEAEFVIAGEGGEKEKLIRFAEKLGISEKIKFLGKVTEAEKISLFQKAWVFINTSFMEGWGLTTIEANACGTPAIVSNVPGLRDSVRDKTTGVLIRYGKYDGFARTIVSLIKDETLREKMSEESVYWSTNFSWEESAVSFSNLLFEELEKAPLATTSRLTNAFSRILSLL